jgi:uncharacterized protein (DUF2062 family)
MSAASRETSLTRFHELFWPLVLALLLGSLPLLVMLIGQLIMLAVFRHVADMLRRRQRKIAERFCGRFLF